MPRGKRDQALADRIAQITRAYKEKYSLSFVDFAEEVSEFMPNDAPIAPQRLWLISTGRRLPSVVEMAFILQRSAVTRQDNRPVIFEWALPIREELRKSPRVGYKSVRRLTESGLDDQEHFTMI